MVVGSLYTIFTALGLKGLPSTVSFFWVNVFAAVFFLVIVLVRGKMHELTNRKALYYIFGVVIFIMVFLYGLQFYALTKTIPANASIVCLFEIVPSFIFFQMMRKEHFRRRHILGVLFAITGALIVLVPRAGNVNTGDLIILVSLLFAPLGNWCQQQARKLISSESILFLRHLIALPFLFLITLFLKTPISDYNIYPAIGWLLLNAIVIFGISKILWVESIHRITVTRVLSVNALAPIFTMIFAWMIMNQLPTHSQLLSLPFLICAVLLLTNFSFRKEIAENNI
jgi:drug/metabolite transporter (DMT)-like permease